METNPFDFTGLTTETLGVGAPWFYALDLQVVTDIFGLKEPTSGHEEGHILRPVWDSSGCWCCSLNYDDGDECNWKPARFSKDEEMALRIVEKMRSEFPYVRIDWIGTWGVSFQVGGDVTSVIWSPVVSADTLPVAICVAALLAKGKVVTRP